MFDEREKLRAKRRRAVKRHGELYARARFDPQIEMVDHQFRFRGWGARPSSVVGETKQDRAAYLEAHAEYLRGQAVKENDQRERVRLVREVAAAQAVSEELVPSRDTARKSVGWLDVKKRAQERYNEQLRSGSL